MYSGRLPSILFAAALQLALVAACGGTLQFWAPENPAALLTPQFAFLVAALFAAVGLLLYRRAPCALSFEPLGWILGLFIVLVSDWMCRRYALLHGPAIRGEILLGAVIACFVFSSSVAFRLKLFTIAGCGLLWWSLWRTTGGAPLLTDDHAAVLYRLQLLKENFPFIPFYNPQWNAGMDARDFFATGVLNLFALGAPLIYSFDLTTVYTFLVGAVVFALLPAMTFAASREAGLEREPALIAALLSIAPSAYWYGWVFKYGAMGFVTSAALFAYNSVFLIGLLSGRSVVTRSKVVFATISLTLMLCWSLTVVALLPLVAWGLIRIRRLLGTHNVPTLILLVCAINLPWMLVFVSVSQVLHFTSLEKPRIESAREMGEGENVAHELTSRVVRATKASVEPIELLNQLRRFAAQANPLLLLLGLPGILLLRGRSDRALWGVLTLWLLGLGFLAAALKPQLELERMLILLLFALCVPAGAVCWRFWEGAKEALLCRVAAIVSAGFVFAGVFAAGTFASDHSLEHYTYLNKSVSEMADAIRTKGGDGRTAFTAFVLHELNGGHVAPMALLSGRPLVASSPIHNLWWYTDLIPGEFRKRGEAGIEEYFDLLNASAVVAHEPVWQKYFLTKPDRYTQIWSGKKFIVFRRTHARLDYFLEGSGEVLEQDTNHVRLRVDGSQAVIKFVHYPFLESSGCDLGRRTIGSATHLIELKNCTPGATIEIRSVGALARVLQTWRSRDKNPNEEEQGKP